MDMSVINASLQAMQMSIATFTLSKAMDQGTEAVVMMLEDMAAAMPPVSPGGMDIRV